jgi:ABC-type branched-subunit amino acid transport system ATPase component
VLTVSDLRVAYGGVVAVDGVSFEAHGGEILGIVGPNGAGKTSLLDGICGFVPTTGSVTLDDVALPSGRPHTRQALGIGRTWQHGALFDDLTVLDNLAVAADPARPGDVLRDLRSASGVERKRLLEVLEAWGIADIADRKPGELSIGRRKLVDIARAVAAEPTVLLADEPAAGLDDWESEELATRLRSYAATGRTVVLIEHDLSLVRRVCDRILVLDFGRVLATGEPEVVLGQPKVAAAYLGLAGTGAAS